MVDSYVFAPVTREFRSLWKAVADVQRRLAATEMPGTIAEIDGKLVRVKLGEADQRTGKTFLSPWVQLQDAAGSTATHTPVAIGDPVRLHSPNGEIGPRSLAIRDSHTDQAPNPASDMQELVITHAGCAIRMRDNLLILTNGVAEHRFEGDLSKITSARHTHNKANVGDTHKHQDVWSGPDLTGLPV